METTCHYCNLVLNPDTTREKFGRRFHQRCLEFMPIHIAREYKQAYEEQQEALRDVRRDVEHALGFPPAGLPEPTVVDFGEIDAAFRTIYLAAVFDREDMLAFLAPDVHQTPAMSTNTVFSDTVRRLGVIEKMVRNLLGKAVVRQWLEDDVKQNPTPPH